MDRSEAIAVLRRECMRIINGEYQAYDIDTDKLQDALVRAVFTMEIVSTVLATVDADLAEASELGYSHQSNAVIRGYIEPLRETGASK